NIFSILVLFYFHFENVVVDWLKEGDELVARVVILWNNQSSVVFAGKVRHIGGKILRTYPVALEVRNLAITNAVNLDDGKGRLVAPRTFGRISGQNVNTCLGWLFNREQAIFISGVFGDKQL